MYETSFQLEKSPFTLLHAVLWLQCIVERAKKSGDWTGILPTVAEREKPKVCVTAYHVFSHMAAAGL